MYKMSELISFSGRIGMPLNDMKKMRSAKKLVVNLM